jgi:hypothetical protein
MFNLEQAIANWRKQMLAAGIKTPVPLDELEVHLRDAIEQQAKSGLSEAETFLAAVEAIGKIRLLQQEFKKVEKGHKIIRAIMLVIGWLAASFALAYSVFRWDLDWNFFSFSPGWNLELIWAMLGILVALTAFWFLMKASRDKASRVGSLLVCMLFAGLALMALRPEPPVNGFLGRSEPSPIWFRGVLSLVLCVPGAFWFWWMRQHLARKRGSTRVHRKSNNKQKNMNKKIITLVSVAAVAAILLLLAIGRLMPIGESHNLVSDTIEVVGTLLALPVRLYAFFIYGDHGSWPLPVLILLLAVSGLMWGVIVERIVWIFSKRNTAQ